ncbi:hypothetical protein PSACC_01455 [Paramicrosporidium saccamoebae]|uniref:Uncharacterized protein n=1 Tax=Paramicrosporidium saccamoebae TaxID=1246581 RepID=A0A2H9TM50_9FUNG|nr:hypothetical protein PSACC_01455 [Paramicrosporidium saccamoebae]
MIGFFVWNNTGSHFKVSSAPHCEIESQEEFWRQETEEILPNSSVNIGQMTALGKFNSECRACVSILINLANSENLTQADPVADGSEPIQDESSLIVRVNIKKTAAQMKLWYTLSSIPDYRLFPPPSWHRSNSQTMAETLQAGRSTGFEEVYENEHKNHTLGHARYSKSALGMTDRSAWTSERGGRRPKPELLFLFSPCLAWQEEWKVDIIDGVTDEEGWMYSSGWNNLWSPHKSFSKIVRRRRWFRIFKNSNDKCALSKTCTTDKGTMLNSTTTDPSVLNRLISQEKPNKLTYCYYMENEGSLNYLAYKAEFFKLLRLQLSPDCQKTCLAKLGAISPRYLRDGL